MTIGEVLAHGTQTLTAAGTDSARLDCLILLEDALRRDRASILAHLNDDLPDEIAAILNNHIAQRATHVPLAYIRGKAAFYGRDFTVTPDVLVPRPETEAIIELLHRLPLGKRPHIADIGTGSGCVAITAALEVKGSVVDAYDTSEAALEVTRANAHRHHASIHVHRCDLLSNPARPHDVILANLPYVPDGYPVNDAARHEPSMALYGGDDGLRLYRRLWQQIDALEPQPAFVLTEALPAQHSAMIALAVAAGYRPQIGIDYIQVFSLLAQRSG